MYQVIYLPRSDDQWAVIRVFLHNLTLATSLLLAYSYLQGFGRLCRQGGQARPRLFESARFLTGVFAVQAMLFSKVTHARRKNMFGCSGLRVEPKTRAVSEHERNDQPTCRLKEKSLATSLDQRRLGTKQKKSASHEFNKKKRTRSTYKSLKQNCRCKSRRSWRFQKSQAAEDHPIFLKKTPSREA